MKHGVLFLSLLLLAFPISLATMQEPTTIQVMTIIGELTPEEIAVFEADNPDIRIELLPATTFSLDLAFSTGEMPDVIRIDSSQVPGLVEQGILLDLTDFFEASEIIEPGLTHEDFE